MSLEPANVVSVVAELEKTSAKVFDLLLEQDDLIVFAAGLLEVELEQHCDRTYI